MMRTVPRHQLDLSLALQQTEWFSEQIFNDHLPKLVSEPLRVDYLFSDADLLVKYHCAGDPKAQLAPTWESATLALQAGFALYSTGLRSEGTVECAIHDSRIMLPATGPKWWMDISRWFKAIYYSMICREKTATDLFCTVTQDFMQSCTGGIAAPWAFPFSEAIKGWWLRQDGHYAHLIEAMKHADPDNPAYDAEDKEHIAFHVFPQLRLFNALITRQPTEFNDILFDALESHKAYWTRTPERAQNPGGYIAMAPLAFACLARESGFPIEVQSEYLPENLVNGAWVGEFPIL